MSFLKPGLITGRTKGATGKTEAGVSESRANRDDLLRLFGARNMPSSVMVRQGHSKIKELDDMAAGSYTATAYKHENNAFQRAVDASGKGVRNRKLQSTLAASGQGVARGALSVFPQNIGRTVLLFYTKPGDLVIDPFAGHNSRMQLCVSNERRYIGFDICHRFMVSNRERAHNLMAVFDVDIILHEQDSRSLQPCVDGSGDFTITSPPYYDVEFYGDEPQQMSKCKTYRQFLDSMLEVLRENFRVLKPGAFAVWFINDFRRKGVMHFYHMDILELGRIAGFAPHDIGIVDFGPGLRDVFINQAMEQKILPKRHEYFVVFKKPE